MPRPTIPTSNRIRMLAGALVLLASGPGLAPMASAAVDEILVTATKRERSLQDVPVAVTPVSAELADMAGITDLRDVMQVSPSFSFQTGQSSAAGTTAFIRGIGTGGDNPGFESAVGFFIDGIYRNRSNVGISELPELERIEVLRGPQGTLFGKNTSAGALNAVTAGLAFTAQSYAETGAGAYDAVHLAAGTTGPVSETLALRIDGKLRERDGIIKDRRGDKDLNTLDRWFLRGQALWQPRSDISLRIIADYAQTDEFCCSAIATHAGITAPGINAVAAATGGVGLVVADPDERLTSISPARDTREEVEEWGLSAELDWTLGFGTLTSITAYRDWKAIRNMDIDFTDVDRAYRDGYQTGFETFTQELRLQGETGRVNWLVGAFYADETLPHKDAIRFGADAPLYLDALALGLTGSEIYGSLGMGAPLLASGYLTIPTAGVGQVADRYTVDTETMALFTHNVIDVTDRLDLTLGLRLNHETKDISVDLNSVHPSCAELAAEELLNPGTIAALGALALLACNPTIATEHNTAGGVFTSTGAPASGDTEETEWTGTAALSYDLTPDLMVYGSYARGYKAGGYNLDRAGFDALLFGGDGAQISDLAFDPEFVDAYELGWKSTFWGRTITLNGALFYQVVEDYQINFFAGSAFVTTNAKEVISKGLELDLIARPVDGLTVQSGLLLNEADYGEDIGLVIGGRQVDDRRLFNAPRIVLTNAATYAFPLANTGLGAFVHGDMRWTSRAYTYADLDPRKANPSHAIFNARAGVSGGEGRWRVEAFVLNLTDTYYAQLAFDAPEQTGTILAYPNEPRTWGLTARISF